MTPIRLSHTWTRRLYVGLFLLGLAYLGLFVLTLLQPEKIPSSLAPDVIVGVGAFLVTAGSIAGFFTFKKTSSYIPALVIYALFTLVTAYLVLRTGSTTSPFLAVWTLAIFFAPLFGVYGWLPGLISIGIYAAFVYISEGQLSFQNALFISLSSFVPIIAGMFIWREVPNSEDASERNVKNLASQLSEVATKSEIVINAIGDGVIALDGKGVIQLINPAAQEILGWGKQDALMLSYQSILKMVDANNNELEPSADPIAQVLNTNQRTRNHDITAISQSGKKLNIALVVSPIGAPGGGVIIVFRDVTNEVAEEREQAEFISTASHEMRTPVASIEGYLGLALNPNTAQVDIRARDFIMKAHEAAQHLGRLFQDLLDVSKSEDGRLTNTPRVVDLVAYTQTIVQGLTQKAADKGLELIFKPTQGSALRKIMPVYYVNQDNDHIREIIDNLVENAIKYTPQGSVTVDVDGTDDTVTVSIKDTGLGIPPEDVPHLFQKFYRVNNIDRQAIGGTGLGLYLVRRLAEAMQGNVRVTSDFGSGSTFYLDLPRIDSQEATRLKQQQDADLARMMQSNPAQQQSRPLNYTPASGQVDALPKAAPPPVMTTPAPPAPSSPPVVTPASTRIPVSTPPNPPEPPKQVAATPQTQPTPSAPPVVKQSAPQVAPAVVAIASPAPVSPSASQTDRTAPVVRPATNVPRGESLTREQIAERVRQLEELSKNQRNVTPERQ